MKAQMTTISLNQIIAKTIGCVIAALVTVPAFAQESVRKPVDPRGQFARLAGEVTAPDSQMAGNAFIIGSEGCHILTNYHVAFGESVDASGKVKLVGREKRTTERVVNFAFDLDSKTGKFKRNTRAKVVEFGNFQNGTVMGMMGDVALLRLENCAGKEYGTLPINRPAQGKETPVGKLQTFSVQRSEDGSYKIVSQEQCAADTFTTAVGLFVSNCEIRPGDSGSMVLEDVGGKMQLAGIYSKHTVLQDGTTTTISVFATEILKITDPVLGGQPLVTNPMADTRAPQNDLASANKAPRTVVR